MNTQVNWQKVRSEFQRLANVEQLKNEVARLSQEVRKFDINSVLSPSAKSKVKLFEKKYSELLRTVHQTQRQMDRELARFVREVSSQKTELSKTLKQQRSRLEKLSSDVQKRFASLSKSATKSKPKRTPKKSKAKSTRRTKKSTSTT